MSNSQLNKLKSGIKNGSEITLNLSSNVIGNSNNEYNFPHKLLLTTSFEDFQSFCVCACVRACVRVCVCVCLCVLILFHREGFFRLQDV